MKIIELFSEIQKNPKNTKIYRQLIDYYKSKNEDMIAKAFEELIEDKLGHNDIFGNKKQ